MDHLPIERYMAIRGVRYFSIPFSQKSSVEGDERLDKVLSRAILNGGFHARVRVSGIDESGRVVYRDRKYRTEDFLLGYEFVSIRADAIWEKAAKAVGKEYRDLLRREKKALCPIMEKRRKAFYHEHFEVVCKQVAIAPMDKALFPGLEQNSPTPMYCIDKLDCVSAGFRAREFLGNGREWINRVLSRRPKKAK